MAIKYLDAKRIRGVASEKAALIPTTAAPTSSADFDGSGDYIASGGVLADYGFLTEAFSLSVWIKPDTIALKDIIIDNADVESNNVGIYVRLNTTASTAAMLIKTCNNASVVNLTTSTVWTEGAWQHLCITYDGTTLTCYRNGVSVGTATGAAFTATPNDLLRIGYASDGGDGGYYHGFMSDFLLTDDVLTATEISALAGGTQVSGVSPTISNQKVHYTFFTNFNDSAPSGLGNGTATNTTINTSGGTSPLSAYNTADLPENTLFEETDTYKTYWLQSNAWTINDPTRGVACMGDNNGNSEVYDFVTIATLGNATDFGNCTSPARFDPAACADATRGVCFGGGISASQNIIEYITVATEGNATDFGDMTAATRHNTGMADATYGLSTGGYTTGVVATIDYVTIQTLGNAADFGDLNSITRSHGCCADATRGLVMGGYTSNLTLTISYVTIASTGNSTTFGDTTSARQSPAGCADATRGINGGGVNGSQVNIIDYVTIQTTGNATDFGDLTVNKAECAAYANALRGCFAGGNTGSITDVIEYVTIQTLGNAADFGDSTEARRGCEGLAA